MQDLSSWTDEELANEMAAWACNGEGARLPAEHALHAAGEYERRLGVPQSKDDWKKHYLERLKASRAVALKNPWRS